MKAPFHPRRRTTYIESLESRIAPATIIVTNLNDSGAGSLREAIDTANATTAPDVIKFEEGLGGTINVGAEMLIEAPLTIQGPSSLTIKLDGGGADRIFRIDDGLSSTAIKTAINNLVLQNGKADNGGGILSLETLSLKNTVITGCEATANGGALYAFTSGKITIADSQFLDNTAALYAGAAMVSGEGGISISRTLFVGNVATAGAAGALLISQSPAAKDVTISSSVFSGNTADDDGGALYSNHIKSGPGAKAGKVIVSKSTFINNTSGDEGGAISHNDGLLIVKNSLFRSNSGPRGGAIFHSSPESLAVSGSQFIENQTTGDGGAIGLGGGDPALINKSIFLGNSATNTGGAISAEGVAFKVIGSTFSGNRADAGGAISGRFESVVNVSKSIFTGNFATNAGGAIMTQGSGSDATDLIVSGSTFGLNSADSGGAIDATGGGVVSIAKSKVRGNFTTSNDGGGFYLRSTTKISIVGTLFDANFSRDDGGAVAFGGGGEISVAKSIFTGNVTDDGDSGGAIANFDGSSLTISSSKITGNRAENRGGGVYISSGTLVLKSTKITGNYAPTEPDLYQ